jgi:hypothetical protein
LIGYHPGHPFSEDGGQLTIPSISGNYNCRQAGVLIVADQPDGIASKLHSYWSSHRDPYPVRVETLQKLCGSMMDLKHFKAKLSSALDQLVKIGFLTKWTVAGNLVTVIREKDKIARL